MENALLFTALLLGSALAGGYIGAVCARGKQEENWEKRICVLENRLGVVDDGLDAFAAHSMDEAQKLKDRAGSLEDKMQDVYERLYDVEMLVGDTPTGGLLGRVGALEDQQKVNEAEHHALLEHQKAIVRDMKEAQADGC